MEISLLPVRPGRAGPAARLSYLALSSICRQRYFAASSVRSAEGSFRRSDFSGHGYTGIYEPGPTEGPLKEASNIGVPRITPRSLKEHLDQFVVGQERAKKVLSVAVYNHYQRVQELERQDEEMEEMLAQQARRARAREKTHPLEGTEQLKQGIAYVPDIVQDEFPGQQRTVTSWDPNAPSQPQPSLPPLGSAPIIDASPMTIEKSNIMLLGPSGCGKTLMAKTLARVLEVPFSMSDCTPFTQAGYIGEDADVCVQRLLAAANYDVAKAERGIICLDEIDKIATARVSHGKDVSGEGVQQALLKIIEGTTLQIQAKSERNGSQGRSNRNPDTGSPLSSGSGSAAGQSSSGKAETYHIRTDNILFICTGAFIGLHRHILDRISKGSIGFNAPVRSSPSSSTTNPNDTTITGEDELFRKHLPFYSPPPPPPTSSSTSSTTSSASPQTHNTLDLATPLDLQKFGLIPELVGRIPISCALSPLSVPMLVQVLTEPRNSLLRQYEQLFALSSIELRFTTPALHVIAEQAHEMGTGARGLRTVMERVLGDAMYECPGTGTRYVAVTEGVARREMAAVCFSREEGRAGFASLVAREEEEWEERNRGDEGKGKGQGEAESGSFEEYRSKVGAVGYG
ncbi:ATP-dependent Clp protease ATP-binding subunit ClpX [Sphaceloma murrayae]|uniref:ATP-dependent Clp protease ATP-binding subunit ClpX n=1 Tax=Sphaceloma murrayae TaxID=2082308 RepID=A0A2K1QG71_9PEZI|nr:ATP-dependent Clp protease ATP-binding subunit ClpX [Sphaceloma murrayae]